MVDFYIFRHGETDINKQKRWQGSGTDVDLNETGRAQAACLFDKLKDKKLEIIYSSPLIRAYHTAQIAAKPLGIEVVKFPDLRECHYGVAEGMTFDDVNRLYKEVGEAVFNPGQDKLDVRFPQGESIGARVDCDADDCRRGLSVCRAGRSRRHDEQPARLFRGRKAQSSQLRLYSCGL